MQPLLPLMYHFQAFFRWQPSHCSDGSEVTSPEGVYHSGWRKCTPCCQHAVGYSGELNNQQSVGKRNTAGEDLSCREQGWDQKRKEMVSCCSHFPPHQ